MNMRIVITTIFEPTEAISLFSNIEGCSLIVVGDKKTPAGWHCKNVEYLSLCEQESLGFSLAKHLPYNHYCRKMLGYLWAIRNDAECIVDTDDDNIPKKNWSFPDFEGKYDFIEENLDFINVYQLYTKQKIWPRGLPLNAINKSINLERKMSIKPCRVGVWQGLADEDPDVDAIYRLTNNTPCYFNERKPLVLGKGTVSPFNTQNTIVRKELYALMYLPTYVTFRFTDILRSLVAQPIMWHHSYLLGFTNSTVVQKRNIHDYMQDFISELPMYQYCEKALGTVAASVASNQSIESNLYNAYSALLKEHIVSEQEMYPVEAWLRDLEIFKKPN